MKKIIVFACLATTIFFACKKNKVDNSQVTDADKKEVIVNHANIVLASYEDSYNLVLNLQTKINTFITNPTDANLEGCKTAWKASRVVYNQTDAYRFSDGPIDHENGPEGLMNGWPMDEQFIDYVKGDATSGIINNPKTYPNITPEVLENLNENGGETNIATGYHAIEFLLWGQDLSALTAGQRPYTDYVIGANGTNANQNRRALYLKAAVGLLISNFEYLINQWKLGGVYRTKFTSQMPADSALTSIVRSIGSLTKGELANERMAVALTNQDQEDEHSCFSDNTHIDVQYNFIGIQNVYMGKYVRTNGEVVQGKSLSDLITKKDANKNNLVLAQFSDAKAKLFAIQAPFDQEIILTAGRERVSAAINSCRTLADKIADAAFALGIKN
ncbi:MAG: hypothetical protein EAZ51_07110 [Sphingobacteriales bacterium]|nr:MAG: hypothetical protein EAZ64_09375 [Sphingobacteriales bacterium]TAF79858.1 MAG: hypothetical protein EAZ51_07110 [Sphingobacteriales bacterium]